jgi:hypothetical protein
MCVPETGDGFEQTAGTDQEHVGASSAFLTIGFSLSVDQDRSVEAMGQCAHDGFA